MPPATGAALIVALPLLGAAVLAAIGRRLPPLVPDLAAIACGATVALLFALLLDDALEAPIAVWFGGWLPRAGGAIGIGFYIDGFAAGFGTLIATVFVAATVFAIGYVQDGRELFHALMLVFLAGMSGLCLSADLFNEFVFLELMSVAGFALTAYRREQSPLEAAVGFTIVNSIGGILLLLGIAVVYGASGTLSLAGAGRLLSERAADGAVLLAFCLITTALLIKAAIVPFHFWLVDAHAVAPSPVSVLFSGAMVALGLYLWARIHATVFADAGPPPEVVGALMAGAGAVTAILGGVRAFLQRHLKRLLAFSTVSHMGIALVGIGVLGPRGLAGAALYLLGHGLIKGALFMCAGELLALRGAVDEGELRGRGRDLPWTGLLFATGGLALAGLPGQVGHAGRSLIDHELQGAGLGWLAVLLSIASMLTGAAVLRAAGRIFLGLGPVVAEQGPSEHEDEKPSRPGALMLGPAFALIGIAVALAWLPRLTSAVIEQAAWFGSGHEIAARLLDGAAWAPVPASSAPEHPAPVPGLIAALAAILIAAAALHPDTTAGRVIRRLQGTRLLRRLQDLHSGHVGDYTAWLVLGAAAIGACLAWFGTAR